MFAIKFHWLWADISRCQTEHTEMIIIPSGIENAQRVKAVTRAFPFDQIFTYTSHPTGTRTVINLIIYWIAFLSSFFRVILWEAAISIEPFPSIRIELFKKKEIRMYNWAQYDWRRNKSKRNSPGNAWGMEKRASARNRWRNRCFAPTRKY